MSIECSYSGFKGTSADMAAEKARCASRGCPACSLDGMAAYIHERWQPGSKDLKVAVDLLARCRNNLRSADDDGRPGYYDSSLAELRKEVNDFLHLHLYNPSSNKSEEPVAKTYVLVLKSRLLKENLYYMQSGANMCFDPKEALRFSTRAMAETFLQHNPNSGFEVEELK